MRQSVGGRGAFKGAFAASRSALSWLGGLLALYLAIPLIGFLAEIVTGHASGFSASGLSSALVVSLVTATVTTAICALFGVPLAYTLAHAKGRVAAAVGVLVMLPLALPPLMAGILLVSVVGPYTTIGRLFGGTLTDSMTGIVLAQTFVAAPFAVVAARSAFSAVDPTFADVATTLGLRRGARFLKIALPLAGRGIAAGLLLAWLRAFGEFGATVILAFHPYSLPVFTYVRFGGYGLAAATAPTALALGAAVVVVGLSRVRPRIRHTGFQRVAARTPYERPPVGPISFDVETRAGSFHLSMRHSSARPHLAIIGPSGAGKTTTLRCLAGLAGWPGGQVRLGERLVSEVPTEERSLGYVPQHPTLVPGRSVWRQLMLGRGADPGLAAHWIERLGLSGLEERTPEQLSGGEQHRVALARALCRAPELVLLDEPFTGLDAPVRAEARRDLRALQQRGGFATVIVTHDPDDAAFLADEVLVIDKGRPLQGGTLAEVMSRPATPVVARLLGLSNIHRARIAAPGVVESRGVTITARAARGLAVGSDVRWCVRPERIALSPATTTPEPPRLDGIVRDAVELGSATELRVALTGGIELLVRTPPGEVYAAGSRCAVTIPADEVTVWLEPPESAESPQLETGERA